MADTFAVSRSTLRSALLPLSEAGVLERRTGRSGGTFIRADIVQREAAEQSGLPARLHSTGHTSASTVLAADHRPGTPTECAALEIPHSTAIFAIRRLRYADGVPLSLDLSCFVAEYAADLLEQPLDGSIYELLHRRYDLRPASTTEIIEVVSASPREAKWLDIAHRKPLLAITRVTRDGSGRPFEYAYDLFRADRVRLTATSNGAGVSPVSAGVVPDPA